MTTHNQIFHTSPDRRTITNSLLLIGVLLLIPILIYFATGGQTEGLIVIGVMLAVLLAGSLIVYGLLPTRIEVTTQDIILHSPFKRRFIPIKDVERVRRTTRKDLKNLTRWGAAEGLFGYVGIYKSSIHPRLWVYAKRRRRDWIMIRTRDKKYIVAPVEGDRFIERFCA